jgi:hypothetical protein
MHAKLGDHFISLLTLLVDELAYQQSLDEPSKMALSIILQAISMAFTYNSQVTFHWLTLNQEDRLLPVFSTWFGYIKNFKKDFELRRTLFGLAAIIRTEDHQIPEMVADKLPEIMALCAKLCKAVHFRRYGELEDAKKYIANGGKFAEEDLKQMDKAIED